MGYGGPCQQTKLQAIEKHNMSSSSSLVPWMTTPSKSLLSHLSQYFIYQFHACTMGLMGATTAWLSCHPAFMASCSSGTIWSLCCCTSVGGIFCLDSWASEHFCGGFVGWSYRTLPTLAWCCTYHPLQDCGIVNLIITGNLNAMTLTNNPNINPNIKIVSGLDVLHLLGHWPVTDYLYLSLIHSKAIRADDKTQKICCVDAKGTLFNFSI